jgi:hypothetical protein
MVLCKSRKDAGKAVAEDATRLGSPQSKKFLIDITSATLAVTQRSLTIDSIVYIHHV